jgi:hypothetical protein
MVAAFAWSAEVGRRTEAVTADASERPVEAGRLEVGQASGAGTSCRSGSERDDAGLRGKVRISAVGSRPVLRGSALPDFVGVRAVALACSDGRDWLSLGGATSVSPEEAPNKAASPKGRRGGVRFAGTAGIEIALGRVSESRAVSAPIGTALVRVDSGTASCAAGRLFQ